MISAPVIIIIVKSPQFVLLATERIHKIKIKHKDHIP